MERCECHLYYQRGGNLDILDIIKTRRSIRKFEEMPVPEELLEKVLEAGRWAPSGLNNQPWRFAVIKDAAIREEFSKLTHYSTVIRNADTLIAVFLDNEAGYNRTKDVQALGACIQNMLLEAHSIGLGCVWLGEIIKSSEQTRKILGLPENLELMAALALGYPTEKPKTGKRKHLKDLIVFRG
jgi:nitroreductase